jgi:spore germination cell wall hydrolase CwlJ-like protein
MKSLHIPITLRVILCLTLSFSAVLPATASPQEVVSAITKTEAPLIDTIQMRKRNEAPSINETPQKIRHTSPPRSYVAVAIALESTSYDRLRSEIRNLLRDPPSSLRGQSSLACIAVAIYHEARGQTQHGQLAVASVILQRVAVPNRWGRKACDVVRPVQFSFMKSRYGFPPITERDAWVEAVHLAAKSVVEGPLPELKRADHYHTVDVDPDWSRKMDMVGQIGDHIFFRDPKSSL